MKKLTRKTTNLNKSIKTKVGLDKFYAGFKDGVSEIKASLDGKIELKDADAWLKEIQ